MPAMRETADDPGDSARVALLAPSPILTVTLEHDGSEPELHLHAGGQGFWVARMLRALDIDVSFCAPLGGEIGIVLRALLEAEGLDLLGVDSAGWNGAYVHDRGPDELAEVGETPSPRLTRHEADTLYSAMVSAALVADVAALTGPRSHEVIEADFYRRLASDLRANCRRVGADLSGPALTSALDGGVDLLHISERELGEQVDRPLSERQETIAAVEQLRDAGASNVIVTRGSEPALALLDDRLVEVRGPVFEDRERRGPGDSMFAAVLASLARDPPLEEALRLGAAAGAINAARRGLGSGSRDDIERLARQVELHPC